MGEYADGRTLVVRGTLDSSIPSYTLRLLSEADAAAESSTNLDEAGIALAAAVSFPSSIKQKKIRDSTNNAWAPYEVQAYI